MKIKKNLTYFPKFRQMTLGINVRRKKMKKTFYFALLILAVLFYASCMKVTSEDGDNDLIDIETLNIPEDFVFDMHNNVNVQISVVDGDLQPIEGIVVSVLTDYTNQALKGSTDDEGFFRGIASIPSTMNELTIKANNETVTVNLSETGDELIYQFIVTGRTVTEQTVNITNSLDDQIITFNYYDPTATGQTLTNVEVQMYSTVEGGSCGADNDGGSAENITLHYGASFELEDGTTAPRLLNSSYSNIWNNDTAHTFGPVELAADNGDGSGNFDPNPPDGITYTGVAENDTKSDNIVDGTFEDGYSNPGGGTFTFTLIKDTYFSFNTSGTFDVTFQTNTVGGYIKLIYTDDGIPPDTDGDGVPNEDDDYPDDINRAYDNFYPAAGYGCLVFEDKWPWKHDYDFNDLVVDYQFKTVTNAANEVVEVFGDFVVKAAGSYYRNAFGYSLPDAIPALNTDLTLTGYNISGGLVTLGVDGLESGQSHPTVIVFDDDEVVMPSNGGNFVNTDEGFAYITPVAVNVKLSPPMPTWNAPGEYTMADFSINTFNPFLIIAQERGREVHLPGGEPTWIADQLNNYWFGHFDDNSLYGTNFVTTNNLPWVLNLPASFSYPKETSQITWAYLHFVEWAESGGTLYTDWYSNTGTGYRNLDHIYTAP